MRSMTPAVDRKFSAEASARREINISNNPPHCNNTGDVSSKHTRTHTHTHTHTHTPARPQEISPRYVSYPLQEAAVGKRRLELVQFRPAQLLRFHCFCHRLGCGREGEEVSGCREGQCACTEDRHTPIQGSEHLCGGPRSHTYVRTTAYTTPGVRALSPHANTPTHVRPHALTSC